MVFFKHDVIKTRSVEDVKTQLKDIDLDTLETKSFCLSELNSRELFLIEKKFSLVNNSSISIRKNSYLPFVHALKTTAMIDVFLFYLAVLMNDQAIFAFQKNPLSIWRIHDSASQFRINITKSEFLNRELKLSKEIVTAYQNFMNIITSRHIDIRNAQILIDIINTKLGGWYVRLSLSEGKKCRTKNIFLLAKTGIYLRNLNILLSVLLGLFSLFAPKFAGQIFDWGLWKRKFMD